MRVAGIVLMALSGVLLLIAVNNCFIRPRPAMPGGSLAVSYVVGSFLPFMLTLIFGLILFQKGKR